MRGIVFETKLLESNPWNQFGWIEGRDKPIRQLDAGEIELLLNYLESCWRGVTIALLLAKVFLWSACRQMEITALQWSALRKIDDEVHFHVVGKMGGERWFRIPLSLYEELKALQSKSPFVFAAYNKQLRQFHERSARPDNARRVGEKFDPKCLGDWFADRMDDWSATLPTDDVHTHVFRKTSLQHAREGEDINRQVAADAGVSESVMVTNYVKKTDEQFRQASNRTFNRIAASLPPEISGRCGYVQTSADRLNEELRKATDAKDWSLVRHPGDAAAS